MATLSFELGYLDRRRLALVLDHESPQGRDWMGLADKMRFQYKVIHALKAERSPTLALLEEWEKEVGNQIVMFNCPEQMSQAYHSACS